jgi:hypothetical protein
LQATHALLLFVDATSAHSIQVVFAIEASVCRGCCEQQDASETAAKVLRPMSISPNAKVAIAEPTVGDLKGTAGATVGPTAKVTADSGVCHVSAHYSLQPFS